MEGQIPVNFQNLLRMVLYYKLIKNETCAKVEQARERDLLIKDILRQN